MGEKFLGGLALAKIALGGLQTVGQNQAIDRGVEEDAQLAEAQIQELRRQRQEADQIAQEEKSDRVRQADREVGRLRVNMAEVGGLGTVNAIRGIVDIGAAEGFDLGRIENNRQNRQNTLRASEAAAAARARSSKAVGKLNKRANRISFLGTGLSIAAGAAGDIRDIRRPTDAR